MDYSRWFDTTLKLGEVMAYSTEHINNLALERSAREVGVDKITNINYHTNVSPKTVTVKREAGLFFKDKWSFQETFYAVRIDFILDGEPMFCYIDPIVKSIDQGTFGNRYDVAYVDYDSMFEEFRKLINEKKGVLI